MSGMQEETIHHHGNPNEDSMNQMNRAISQNSNNFMNLSDLEPLPLQQEERFNPRRNDDFCGEESHPKNPGFQPLSGNPLGNLNSTQLGFCFTNTNNPEPNNFGNQGVFQQTGVVNKPQSPYGNSQFNSNSFTHNEALAKQQGANLGQNPNIGGSNSKTSFGFVKTSENKDNTLNNLPNTNPNNNFM